jgi:hypothetical protein
MTLTINKKGILYLAESLIKKYKIPRITNRLISHLETTYDAAEIIVDEILFNNSFLKDKLKKQEITAAAGLHDIGRTLCENQLFHELRGANFIENKGLELNIADSLEEIYRLAQMIRSHGFVAEQFIDWENKKEAAEFSYLNLKLLYPRTLQEIIVTYSDLINVNGKTCEVKERINKIKERYNHRPNSMDRSFINAAEKSLLEFLKYVDNIERLRKESLKEAELSIFEFL